MIEAKNGVMKKLYKVLVINFYHFIGVYMSYVFRTYLEVGHMPFWKHPVYYELTDISRSWQVHYKYVEISFILLFFGALIWFLITPIKLLQSLMKKEANLNFSFKWEFYGFLGFCISNWLLFISSFGFFQWFSD